MKRAQSCNYSSAHLSVFEPLDHSNSSNDPNNPNNPSNLKASSSSAMPAPSQSAWGQPPPVPPRAYPAPHTPSRSAGQSRSDPTTTPDGTPNTISTVHSAPSPVLATPNLGHSFHAKVRLNLAAFHMDKAVQVAGKILDLREDHTEDH